MREEGAMPIWKALHVLSMFSMVTLFIGAEIFYAAAILRRDVPALAFIQSTLERWYLGILALAGMLAGIVFGLLAAASGGFDFVAGWLVVAYLLVAAFFGNSALIGARIVRVAKAAVAAEARGAPADEALTDLPANRGVILVLINTVIFAAIIADMVLKPF